MYSWHAARVFDVLANETRLAMMMELADAQYASVAVTDLAELLDLDERLVLGQAERLCEAGFIVLRRIDRAWEIQLDQDKLLDFVSFVQRKFTPRAERVQAPSRRSARRSTRAVTPLRERLQPAQVATSIADQPAAQAVTELPTNALSPALAENALAATPDTPIAMAPVSKRPKWRIAARGVRKGAPAPKTASKESVPPANLLSGAGQTIAVDYSGLWRS